MSIKNKSQLPESGISSEVGQITEEKTAALITELIGGGNPYSDIVDAVFWMFNDLKDGAYFDELSQLAERLKEFFSIPENNQALCDGCVYLKPDTLYQILNKIHTFVDEVYSYQTHNLHILDLYELTEYTGQIPEQRLNRMYHQYAKDLEIKRATEAIGKKYKPLITLSHAIS